MRLATRITVCLAALMAGAFGTLVMSQQPQSPSQSTWSGCCGVQQWPAGPRMMGPGMMGPGPGMMGGGMGFMARRHEAMMYGLPAPYATMSNPLAMTHETIDQGAKVYAQRCVGCHGAHGAGDGEAGRNLSPPPGNLAWLSQMPMARWDGYIYWTIAEGGTPFGTAMPAFKNTLSSNEIWAVTAYVQAHLPTPAK